RLVVGRWSLVVGHFGLSRRPCCELRPRYFFTTIQTYTIDNRSLMENIIAQLLTDFENGKMTRRQLVQRLAMAATAASAVAATGSSAFAANGFKTLSLDHISYQVANYKKTRDFYAD